MGAYAWLQVGLDSRTVLAPTIAVLNFGHHRD